MTAEWWALGIATLSLGIAVFKDYIKPWMFAPKINLCARNQTFYIEETQNLQKKRYLRLKIENSDGFFNSNAKNCYIKLNTLKKDGEVMHPFTPTPLKWSQYDEGNDVTKRKHNLSKGEHHFIDLCHEIGIGKKILFFQFPLSPKLAEKLGAGKYTFKIGIYGDNFVPKFQTFKVKYTGNFGELKFI